MKKTGFLSLAIVAVFLMVFVVAPSAMAAEKRCSVQGKKVECPVQSDKALEKAAADYEKEAMDMMAGKSGSTYGIAPFDYLTGVGKRTKGTTLTKGDSGYGSGTTGKTELWDRVKKPTKGEAVYNQWQNNWSPSFKVSLIPGADPNEGKLYYYAYCVACHGWLGHGDGPNAVALDPRPRILTAGKRYMNKRTNVELFSVIKGGGGNSDLSEAMPAWGNLLQDQDIWNVLAFIRAIADSTPPKSVEEYLNPKSSFNSKSVANKVTPLNSAKSAEFKDAQELLEAGIAGRGINKGGEFVEGGLRKRPKEAIAKVKKGY